MRKAAFLLTLVVAVATAGLAEAHAKKSFTDADIRGSYGVLSQGSLSLATTPPVTVPVVIVGILTSDGKGNQQGEATANAGATVPAFGSSEFTASLTGTYDVDTDGTGDFTATLTPPASSAPSTPFDLGGALVIDQDDREVRLLSTGSNRVLLTSAKKQHKPKGGFSNANLRGNWGFSCQGTLVTSVGDPTAVESQVAVVGLLTDDGKGDFSAEVTANTGGAILQSSFSGNTHVASDGFITATATSADPIFARLRGVMDSTDEFRLITIDPGEIVSCTAAKQEEHRNKTD